MTSILWPMEVEVVGLSFGEHVNEVEEHDEESDVDSGGNVELQLQGGPPSAAG